MKPDADFRRNMSPELPLTNDTVTCLTCHIVASQCKPESRDGVSNPFFLRCDENGLTGEFCFRCHEADNYSPFNAHNQINAGRINEDVCRWCHLAVPDIETGGLESTSCDLRAESSGVCKNCHSKPLHHPTDKEHMALIPSPEMRSYMAAYEIKYRMNLPFPKLLDYVTASGRKTRRLPLDEEGRITCYTCHNPHEKDLLPTANPRSLGADDDKAANHRLRVGEDVICRACHYK